VGSGEGGGGGAAAVDGDQLGDVGSGEALAQAPVTRRVCSGARTRLVSAIVWQSCRSEACIVCE
jgi:hypothetical protein